MRVALRGRQLEPLRQLLADFNLAEDDNRPTVVITHGGDGALLGAEREFPGVPKVPIRAGDGKGQCDFHRTEEILRRLVEDRLGRTDMLKLCVSFNGQTKHGINEVGLHMANPASALRFRLDVNERPYVTDDIIGDGLVVATPFGSTAYFHSITRGSFCEGMGLAINNSVQPVAWAVLSTHERICVTLQRGPAVVIADNDPEQWQLTAGDVVEFYAGNDTAVVLGLDALTCSDCQHDRKRPPR